MNDESWCPDAAQRKAFSDTMGHYSRKDVLSLNYYCNPIQSLSMAYEKFPKDYLEQTCERYEIDKNQLESFIENILEEKLKEADLAD